MTRWKLALLVALALLAAPAAVSDEVVLEGRVVGPGGEPVEGATVRVRADGPDRKTAVLTTDANGTFVVSGMPASSFRVHVSAPRLAPFSAADVAPGTNLSIELGPGHELAGRVLDIQTGKPIANAEVLAGGQGGALFGEEASRSTRTDDDGRFRVEGLETGGHFVTVRAPGHATYGIHLNIPAEKDPETGEPRRVEARLGPGGRISGSVVGAEGQPVEGAWVRVIAMEPWTDPQAQYMPRSTRTDEQGAYELRGVPAGPRFSLTVRRRGYSEARHEPIVLKAGEHISDLDIALSTGATLALRLIDQNERPITTLEGRLVPERPETRAERRGVPLKRESIDSSDDGRHRVGNLPPGRFRLELTIEDYEPVEHEDVRLREGATRDLGTIVMREGRSVRGRVIDPDGEPVADAPVSATWSDGDRYRKRRKVTDESGRFRFSGITDERVQQLRVEAPGFASYERGQVAADGEEMEIVLQRAAAVTGRVVLPDGEPAPSFTIEAYLDAGEASEDPFFDVTGSAVRETVADPEGRFALEGLDPATVTIEARAENWAPGRRTGVRLVSGRTVDAGTISLARGLEIRGRVVEGGVGTPVSGATVSARRPTDLPFSVGRPPDRATSSDADGMFELRGLEPGRLTVQAVHPDFSPVEHPVELTEGAALDDLLLRLSQGGQLTGAVRDSDGVAVQGATIMLVKEMRFDKAQQRDTGEDGRYRFERLEPGAYLVAADVPGRAALGAGMKSATIREGETTVVDFVEREEIRLSGRVLRGDAPLGDTMLTFFAGMAGGSMLAEGVQIKTSRSDATGRYEIGLDEPGEYQVFIGDPAGPGPHNTVRLQVPDGPEVVRDIVLRTHRITGFVTDDEGRPVAGAMVEARPGTSGPMDFSGRATGTTDESGAYVLEGLEPGTYHVQADAEGFPSAERFPVEVAEGTVEVDLQLERGRRLRGSVFDPAGRPVRRAIVMVARAGAELETPAAQGATDVNGVFDIEVPGDEALDVTAVAAGWAPARVEGVLPPGPDEAPLRIVLTAGGSVRVSVLDPSGAPAAGVQVIARSVIPSVTDFLRAFEAPKLTDANGTLWIRSLAPGRYELTVPGGHGVPPVQVTVNEGQDSEATLRIPEGAGSEHDHDHH